MSTVSYPSPTTLLGFAGSLRTGSYNRALLRAAGELLPAGAALELFELGPLPLYNGDLDTDTDRPVAVTHFRQAIARSEGLLIATPEYNYSFSGVLKNALDWASRPAFKSPLAGKPVAIIGTSPGAYGTARAQGQLKAVLLSTLALVFPHPEVALGGAGQKFSSEGVLIDAGAREQLAKLLVAYLDFVRGR